MTLKLLFAGEHSRFDEFKTEIPLACDAHGIKVDFRTNHAPEDVDYVIYSPKGPITDFAPFTKAKAVMNLWAGVEKVVGNETLNLPLTRMVDQGLEEGMTDWVTGHVMRYHLGMDRQILNQNGKWEPVTPPLARNRTIAILGIGALGRACAKALAGLKFNVIGWSRTQKEIAGVTCLSGDDGLTKALSEAEIVVTVLPRTAETENILNAERISLMKPGAMVINPGRGELIDDDALLAALDTGQIGHATLDVFRIEPLPATHPYWTHPKVTVTPHIAAETRARSSAEVIAENIRRNEAREEMLYLVDRTLGY